MDSKKDGLPLGRTGWTVRDTTQGSETVEAETQSLYYAEVKIIIDCDNLVEREVLRKVVNRKKRVKRERRQEGKKNRGVKTFHRLRATSRVHIRTTAALES